MSAIWPLSGEASRGFFPWPRQNVAAQKAQAEWQESFAFRPVRTAQGVVFMAPVFRRAKADGSYEYRAMTEAETADYVSRDAW
jgi:hypothetical protein